MAETLYGVHIIMFYLKLIYCFLFFIYPLSILSQINTISSSGKISDIIYAHKVGTKTDVFQNKNEIIFEIKYQNPNCGNFIIFSNKIINKRLRFRLFNLEGSLINEQFLIFNDQGFSSFENQNLKSGIYIIQTYFKGKNYSDKLLIKCKD